MERTPVPSSIRPRKITDNQRSYLLDLVEKHEVPMEVEDTLMKCLRISEDPEEFGMGSQQASEMIDYLKGLPRKANEASGEPEAGMYRRPDGTIMRVYLGQNSGKMLAKQLVQDGASFSMQHGFDRDPSQIRFSYEYMGKATRFMAGAEKLSLEEAKRFGKMTGHCCVCARRLDVPESVEAGIGPVCARRMEV